MDDEPVWGTQDEPLTITWHFHRWSQWTQVSYDTRFVSKRGSTASARLTQKRTCAVCKLTKIRTQYVY